MAHKFKVGDKVVANRDNDYCKKGDVVTLEHDDGSCSPRFELASGAKWWMLEDDFDLCPITFEHMFSRIEKYLPTSGHHRVGEHLQFYRNSDSTFIDIQVDGFAMSAMHYDNGKITKSVGLQAHWGEALRLLDEYEAEQAPVEMTIKEIADKLGIDSSKLKIKE